MLWTRVVSLQINYECEHRYNISILCSFKRPKQRESLEKVLDQVPKRVSGPVTFICGKTYNVIAHKFSEKEREMERDHHWSSIFYPPDQVVMFMGIFIGPNRFCPLVHFIKGFFHSQMEFDRNYILSCINSWPLDHIKFFHIPRL